MDTFYANLIALRSVLSLLHGEVLKVLHDAVFAAGRPTWAQAAACANGEMDKRDDQDESEAGEEGYPWPIRNRLQIEGETVSYVSSTKNTRLTFGEKATIQRGEDFYVQIRALNGAIWAEVYIGGPDPTDRDMCFVEALHRACLSQGAHLEVNWVDGAPTPCPDLPPALSERVPVGWPLKKGGFAGCEHSVTVKVSGARVQGKERYRYNGSAH